MKGSPQYKCPLCHQRIVRNRLIEDGDIDISRLEHLLKLRSRFRNANQCLKEAREFLFTSKYRTGDKTADGAFSLLVAVEQIYQIFERELNRELAMHGESKI